MRECAGKVVLSINDHPDIRQAFAGFTIVPLQIRYTLARDRGDEAAGELIVKNWDDAQAQLL